MRRAEISLLDSFKNLLAQARAGPDGGFGLNGFAGVPHRLDPRSRENRGSGSFGDTLGYSCRDEPTPLPLDSDTAGKIRPSKSASAFSLPPLLQPILEHHRRVEVFDFQITRCHHFERLLRYQAD